VSGEINIVIGGPVNPSLTCGGGHSPCGRPGFRFLGKCQIKAYAHYGTSPIPPLASAQDVDAALMLLAFGADWLAGIVEPRTEGAGSAYAAVVPPVTESNCMDASFM
jgi:hypothetical protein